MPHKGFLFLGLIACLVVAAGPGRVEAGDGQVIQKVSAIGQRNLRPFTAKDGWEIQWDSKGSLLTITVFNADGKLVDIAATQKGPGSGSSSRRKGGDYYLRVSGTGKWTVTVVQLP
jgi:hypothetical protein